MTAYLGNLSDDIYEMRRHRRACVSVQPHQCQDKAEFLVLRFIYLIDFNSHEIVFKSSSFIVRSFFYFSI